MTYICLIQSLFKNSWWMEADKPWQTLASVFELSRILKSPNPEAFCSSIPIHQDGSCNGLQHYAAIMRDQKGGVSVNLTKSEFKNDVYTDVTNIVKAKNRDSALKGNKIAALVEPFISRKTIKQSVMTTVYGVTLIGAKDQIKKQLEEQGFDQKFLPNASIHLAKLTINSLMDLFPAGERLKVFLLLFLA